METKTKKENSVHTLRTLTDATKNAVNAAYDAIHANKDKTASITDLSNLALFAAETLLQKDFVAYEKNFEKGGLFEKIVKPTGDDVAINKARQSIRKAKSDAFILHAVLEKCENKQFSYITKKEEAILVSLADVAAWDTVSPFPFVISSAVKAAKEIAAKQSALQIEEAEAIEAFMQNDTECQEMTTRDFAAFKLSLDKDKVKRQAILTEGRAIIAANLELQKSLASEKSDTTERVLTLVKTMGNVERQALIDRLITGERDKDANESMAQAS